MSRYRDITEYANVRMVHLDLLELSAPGRQTMTVIGMDVQNGIGRPSDFCFPGLSSNNNRRLMDNCLTYPGYSEPSIHHLRLSEEDPVESFEALRESNRAANAKIRANKIIEEEELKKARAARAEKLIEEEQRSKERAVKKKVKKQKQRERKRCEKLEKEEPDTENGKVTNGSQQSKGDSKAVNGSFTKDNANSSKDQRTISETLEESLYFTASSDEDGEQESDSSTSEELDMSSSFVSKAALIVNRKLEQKEKKKNTVKEEKNPVKEESQGSKETQPPPKEQSNEVQNHIKENALTIVSPRKMDFKDNIQTSTEFAGLGNKYASSGQFDLAINYFTEAIKYNPTEYKLFGNRSFCFEKMQTFEKSLTDAEVSLTMCPGWVKGLYRKGRALAGLKRYEEAAIAFKEVLKLDSSCVDAAQELMRVQITQLMGYGFTREQSSNALIIHGTVDKALEVLSELHWRPGTINNGIHPTLSPPLPPAEMKNVTSLYPVPLAATRPSPPQSQEEPKQSVSNKPWVPVHNKPNVQTRPNPNPVIKKATVEDQHEQEQELFPVWVGNLEKSVTETMVMDLFKRAGVVHSAKVLSYRRCAFINFTNPKHCKEAMKLFHGYLLMGVNIVVRYPDRLSRGMGISSTACNAEYLPDKECFFWRNVGCNRGASCRYRHIKENYRIDFGKKKTIPSE